MQQLKYLEKNVEELQVINKSTFICRLIKVESVLEASEVIEKIKKEFPDANHHCYAYIIGDNEEYKRAYDDNEPSKTAGAPILNVLEKNNLTNVISVVIRYFGGVKLGAGGLVRAYSSSCVNALNIASFAKKKELKKYELTISYNYSNIEKFLKEKYIILEESYLAKIVYIIACSDVDEFIDFIRNKTNGSALFKEIGTHNVYLPI